MAPSLGSDAWTPQLAPKATINKTAIFTLAILMFPSLFEQLYSFIDESSLVVSWV
jgi:hypothetical protein